MNDKKEVNNKLINFLNFPNKLNILTTFLIFILYGVLLFVIISIVFPEYDYTVKHDYKKLGQDDLPTYRDEINAYALLRTETERNIEDNDKFVNSTRLSGYVREMGNSGIKEVSYAFSALDRNDRMWYFIDYKSTLPINYHATQVTNPVYYANTLANPQGDPLEKLFVKLKYHITIDEVIESRELRFSEDILQLKKSELPDYKLGNTIFDLVTVHFEVKDNSSNENKYEVRFKIETADKQKHYQINFQSWVVTKNENIYPLLGLYNYSNSIDFSHTNHPTNINKYINPEWIYSKLVYTDFETNEKSELLYKAKIENILNN